MSGKPALGWGEQRGGQEEAWGRVAARQEAFSGLSRAGRWTHLQVPPTPGMSERERQVMKKLKEVVDKQRDEIRAKDRELGLKNEDVEAVSDAPLPRVHLPGW